MVFESLYASHQRGELLCINGGMCQWHLRRDSQITIQVIIATKRGRGGHLLAELKRIGRECGATSLFAKCPADLMANDWYRRKGFRLEDSSYTSTERPINHWRLRL